MTEYLARWCGRIMLAVYCTGFISACIVMLVKLVMWIRHRWREVTGW